jgi:hypothetical protein
MKFFGLFAVDQKHIVVCWGGYAEVKVFAPTAPSPVML